MYQMRRLLFIAIITSFALSSASAQKKGDFELGIGLGVNLSNVSTMDGKTKSSSLTSFNTGVSGEYYFSDRWGLKTKLIIDNKGWADGFIQTQSGTTTTDFKLNYITIPVMANWHFGSSRNWYLNFGPYIGFLMSAKDSELSIDNKSAFKSTDLGLALGIGYKFKINNNTKFFVEYQEQAGVTDIFKTNLGDPVRNGRTSFNLGLTFML